MGGKCSWSLWQRYVDLTIISLKRASDLWGPDIGQEVLPVSFQIADQDKFLFKAVTGAFAEDHEFIAGYGDLDFFNGIESCSGAGRAAYRTLQRSAPTSRTVNV